MSEENINEVNEDKATESSQSLKYSDFFNDESKQTNGNYDVACKICSEKFI